MRTVRRLAAVVAVVSLAACAPAPEPEPATGTLDDEQAIRDMMQAYATAWSAADSATIVGMLAENYQEVQPDGTHMQSRADVEAMMGEEFANRPEGLSMSIETTFVQWQTANVATAGGTFSMAGLPEDAPPGIPAGGSFLVVLKREGDGWQVTNGLGAANVPEPTEG